MKRIGQLVAAVVFVATMAFSGAGAVAQESDTTQLLVQSIYCADDTGFASGDCSPASGVSATAQLAGGAVLGSCATESGMIRDAAVGYCYIEVPYDVDVLVTQDDGTLSQGYVSTNNPQQVIVRGSTDDTPDYIPTALFINVPSVEAPAPPPAEETPAPVASLPKTGMGAALNEAPSSLFMAMAALCSLAIGGAALRVKTGRR